MSTFNFSRPIRYCPHCGEPIGACLIGGQDRPFCASCKTAFYEDPKLAVAVLVCSKGGLVLQRRKIDPGMGKWTFPSGYVERGERVEHAAARETLEETGLEVRVDRLLGLYSHPGNPVVLAVYSAAAVGGALTVSEESHDVATFPPDRLPELAFEHDAQIVETWLRSSRID